MIVMAVRADDIVLAFTTRIERLVVIVLDRILLKVGPEMSIAIYVMSAFRGLLLSGFPRKCSALERSFYS